MTCSVEGCESSVRSKKLALCGKHYQRFKKHGDVEPADLRPRLVYPDTIWKRINYDGPVPDYAPHLGPCWIWKGSAHVTGYGQVSIPPGVFDESPHNMRAHRAVYMLRVGPIPEGLGLDHLCRVTLCVNPAHLEPCTDRVNTLRGFGPTAINAAKTHCKHGHEFTPENTHIPPSGYRHCRTCANARRNNYR